jgi:hypothetical protein
MELNRKEVTRINKVLSKISKGNTSLSDWLDIASKEHPLLAKALEGIYCGQDGSIHEQLGNTKYWIMMGWHTVSTAPRVEYAYIS